MTSIRQILEDPTASRWLQNALAQALDRDAIDAANNAEVLAEILIVRADRMLADMALGDMEQIELRGGFQTCPKCGAGR